MALIIITQKTVKNQPIQLKSIYFVQCTILFPLVHTLQFELHRNSIQFPSMCLLILIAGQTLLHPHTFKCVSDSYKINTLKLLGFSFLDKYFSYNAIYWQNLKRNVYFFFKQNMIRFITNHTLRQNVYQTFGTSSIIKS